MTILIVCGIILVFTIVFFSKTMTDYVDKKITKNQTVIFIILSIIFIFPVIYIALVGSNKIECKLIGQTNHLITVDTNIVQKTYVTYKYIWNGVVLAPIPFYHAIPGEYTTNVDTNHFWTVKNKKIFKRKEKLNRDISTKGLNKTNLDFLFEKEQNIKNPELSKKTILKAMREIEIEEKRNREVIDSKVLDKTILNSLPQREKKKFLKHFKDTDSFNRRFDSN
jgi:hypothetical protein